MQLMSLKVRQHLLRASMSQTDRYGQKNPQSLKTSCFPQMLLTDDSCWASSKPSRRKESSRFAPDGAHKRLSGSRPGNSARAPGSQREPPGGTEPPKELLLSAATSPPRPAHSHAALLLMRIRCVRRVLVNSQRQQMPASTTNPP